ncbi:MAG: transglutaminase domain-containing protein [Bacteroidota bacterium]
MLRFRHHLFILFATLSVSLIAAAQDDDKNVVIESKSQTFSFSKAKGDNPVEIQEQYTEQYRCNEVRTEVMFSEMYNENETIKDVDARVDDKKAKWINPSYDYYSVENIFYSDAKVCYFKLPLEKKGSHSSVTLTKTFKDPRYFTTVYFNEGYPTENKTVVFSIPRWMKVDIKEYNFGDYNIKKTSVYDTKADADIITYTIKNLPAYKRESAAPGGSWIYPHLLVLCKEASIDGSKIVFFNTVADQYKWYRQLVSGIGDDKTSLEQKAKEITAGITGDKEKIKAVFNWVQHNIRYIAFEDGIAGFKPAKANLVLSKKYGDCKGMANLTRGLLQSLGYDARLCWIGTNHIMYDYSTPSMAVDNHMICALFYQGKEYFLDATETNIGFNEYAERIQGRQVLIENGDNYLLERVPSVTPEQNTEAEKAILSFDGTENLKGTVKITYKGESRSDLLSKIQGTKKDNLQNALTNFLAEDNARYMISDMNTNTLLGTDSLLNISYNVLYKGAASAFDKEVYLEADFRKELDGFIIDSVKRKFDMMLPFRMNIITENSIAVPAGYKVSQLPANKEWKHPNINITISYTKKGDRIEYRKQIRIPDVMLKKKSFADWNRIMKELAAQYREQIIFEKQ